MRPTRRKLRSSGTRWRVSSPDRDQDDIETLIEETATDAPPAEDVAEGLAGLLTEEGRDLAIDLALDVAAADDEIDAAEVGLISDIADGLGMEMDEEGIEMLLEVNLGKDLEDALEDYAQEAEA